MIKYWITIVLLFVVGFGFCSYALFQTNYAPGWDSYFYLDQVKSWMNQGALHSSRLNLIYPSLISLQYIFHDYILSYKTLTIIAYAACPPLLFVLAQKLKLSYWHSLFIALLFIANPISLYFSAQFTKNLIAACFFIGFLTTLTQKHYKTSLILVLILFFSHKLIFAIALLFVCYYIYYHFFQFRFLLIGTILTSFAVLATTLFIVAPQNLSIPHPYPYSFYQSHKEVLPIQCFIIATLCSILIVYCAVRANLANKTEPFQLALISTFAILLCPFLKWGLMDYSFRFYMTFLLLCPLLLLYTTIPKKAVKTLLIGVFIATPFINQAYKPHKQDPPYSAYKNIKETLKPIYTSTDIDLLICHKSLAEYISFHLNKDILPWGVPKSEITPNTYRLSYLPLSLKNALTNNFNDSEYTKISARYYLLKETTWKRFVTTLDTEERLKLFNWKNPITVRTNAIIK